jgi:hypothetical protein
MYPEIRLHTLEEWLREDGWDKRGLRFRAPKDVVLIDRTVKRA